MSVGFVKRTNLRLSLPRLVLQDKDLLHAFLWTQLCVGGDLLQLSIGRAGPRLELLGVVYSLGQGVVVVLEVVHSFDAFSDHGPFFLHFTNLGQHKSGEATTMKERGTKERASEERRDRRYT